MREGKSKDEEQEVEAKREATIYSLLTKLAEALSQGLVELYNVEISADELTIVLPSQQVPRPQAILGPAEAPSPKRAVEAKPEVAAATAVARAVELVARKAVELIRAPFEEPKPKFVGRVVEVKMGATREEGGTREAPIILGGHTMPPYYYIFGHHQQARLPAFGGDVFDLRIGLPKAVRTAFGDAIDNPVEWARLWVTKYGAEAIDIHLVSTDPLIKDAPPSLAVKTVEELLQAVRVPIVVGGSGNPEKDVEVFKAVVEAFPNEGLVINSLNLDMRLEAVCPAIAKTNAVVINFSPMDLDKAEQINRKVYEWVPRNRIMLDLNIGGIGYGTEYGFTAMERARLAALMGNEFLAHPFNVGAANAWGAREAWITMDPYWGPKEIRGPLWETLTCVICLLAGADYFMILHPLTLKVLKDLRGHLFSEPKAADPEKALQWLSSRLPVV